MSLRAMAWSSAIMPSVTRVVRLAGTRCLPLLSRRGRYRGYPVLNKLDERRIVYCGVDLVCDGFLLVLKGFF